MRLFLFFVFSFLSIKVSACEVWYGKYNSQTKWSFSKVQGAGMVEVEVREPDCVPEATVHVLQGGRWRINDSLLSAKKTEEAQERDDKTVFTKKDLKKLLKKLKDKGIDIDMSEGE